MKLQLALFLQLKQMAKDYGYRILLHGAKTSKPVCLSEGYVDELMKPILTT